MSPVRGVSIFLWKCLSRHFRRGGGECRPTPRCLHRSLWCLGPCYGYILSNPFLLSSRSSSLYCLPCTCFLRLFFICPLLSTFGYPCQWGVLEATMAVWTPPPSDTESSSRRHSPGGPIWVLHRRRCGGVVCLLLLFAYCFFFHFRFGLMTLSLRAMMAVCGPKLSETKLADDAISLFF